MKPTHRNVLLFLAMASFQGVTIAQDSLPVPKPPTSEVRPAESPSKSESKPHGDRPRPEFEGEKPRGQEHKRPMNPERGRMDHPQGEKRDGDHGPRPGQPDQQRGPQMKQDGQHPRGPGPRDGQMQHDGPRDDEHKKSGPRDGDRGPRMKQDSQQHRGPDPRSGEMQRKGPPDGQRQDQAFRHGPQQDDRHGMKHRQHGPQHFGQKRPMPPLASPHQGKDHRGPMQPHFGGPAKPRFNPSEQGRHSMHRKHHRGSRGQQSMRQGPPPQAGGNRHQAPVPHHQERREGRDNRAA
jgi:hypothetical protein